MPLEILNNMADLGDSEPKFENFATATPEAEALNIQLEITEFLQSVGSSDDEPPSPSPEHKMPIAICGMAMRLPGGISSDSEFWDLLVNKKDAVSPVPTDRYNINGFQSDVNKNGTIQTKQGYFLNHVDLAHIDASFFSMTRSELEKLDPQHRILLELTR
jgi:hypothetical protein